MTESGGMRKKVRVGTLDPMEEHQGWKRGDRRRVGMACCER